MLTLCFPWRLLGLFLLLKNQLEYVNMDMSDTSLNGLFYPLRMDPVLFITIVGFPGGSVVRHLPANAGDTGDADLIPGSRRSPGEGNGNPLQYSCLENPMDGGAWWVIVHGVTKSWTRLSDFTFIFFVFFWSYFSTDLQ